MKKILFTALSIFLAVVLLTGCAKKQSYAAPSATTVPGVSSVPPETTEPPTTSGSMSTPPKPSFNGGIVDWIFYENMLTYTGTVRVASPFKLTQGMQDMIDDFNTYYPNITVEWIHYNSNSEGNMQLDAKINNGEVDVVHSQGLSYTYARWESGLYLDITDKVMADGIDIATNWGTDAYLYNGSYYTIPFAGTQKYIMINMTAWNNAKLGDIPTEWTWEEYLEACRKMTKTDSDGIVDIYGGSGLYTSGSNTVLDTALCCLAQVTGGDLYFSADGTQSNYDDPIAINALERQLKAMLEEKVWFPGRFNSGSGFVDYDYFLKGMYASTVSTAGISCIDSSAYDKTRTFITAFAPYPVEEKGQTNYMSGVQYSSHLGIAKNCADETAAWLFVKYMTSFGSVYAARAGELSTWRGTDNSIYMTVLYGTEENAKRYIDVESFLQVIGKTDLPTCRQTVTADAMAVYTQVTGALKDPVMRALAGEITAEDALKEAAESANAYIQGTAKGK